MQSVNVRQLKNNPSEALRKAASEGPVLVLKGDHPEALLVHLDLGSLLAPGEVLLALASSLYNSGSVSLGRAARIAEVSVSDFVTHVSRLGLTVGEMEASEVRESLETLDEWLESS